jgi:Mn-containing catalase
MSELKELLVEQLQDLLNAENQLVGALPKMVEAANDGKLQEAFQKHLVQTEGHVQRLKTALQLLGGDSESKPCKAMKGLLEEGQETIEEGEDKDELTADLALIVAAQKVEHYEISGYGNARSLARLLNERQVATLLSHTLGEEESADHLLSEITKPIVQEAMSAEIGNGTKTPWGEPGESGKSNANPVMGQSKVRTAAVGGSSALKAKKKA